jgi:hypothetical protein
MASILSAEEIDAVARFVKVRLAGPTAGPAAN